MLAFFRYFKLISMLRSEGLFHRGHEKGRIRGIGISIKNLCWITAVVGGSVFTLSRIAVAKAAVRDARCAAAPGMGSAVPLESADREFVSVPSLAITAIPTLRTVASLPRRSPFLPTLTPEVRALYERYFKNDYLGFEHMRGENGLLRDTVLLQRDAAGKLAVKDYNTGAAPTDIAMDLIVQVGALRWAGYRTHAQQNLEQIISVLEKLEFHRPTGLFFRQYTTLLNPPKKVLNRDLSSVDNMHLAVALWTVSRGAPRGVLPLLATRAKVLFQRMDFSVFYDPKVKLATVNLESRVSSSGVESYHASASHYLLGTEARSLYTAGYALNLFRSLPTEGKQLLQVLAEVPFEIARDVKTGAREALVVWDGGWFQELVPTHLLNEELYSEFFRESDRCVTSEMFEHQRRVVLKDGRTVEVPAAATATVDYVQEFPDGHIEVFYDGKLGFTGLKSPSNHDRILDDVVAAHGLFLGAAIDPLRFAPKLQEVETIDGGSLPFYVEGYGWLASAHLTKVIKKSEVALDKTPFDAKTNPVLVGVDKGFALLALLRILDPDGLSPSGRAFLEDPTTSSRLSEAYAVIDERARLARSKLGP